MTPKALEITSAILGLVSGMCLSLGVLSPGFVRATGLRLAKGMLAKPRSRLLQLAHGKTFHPSKDVFEECVVEFWVSLLTATAALCLTVGVLVGLSGWAFAISHRLGYSGLRWVSAAGGLVAVGAALDLTQAPSTLLKSNSFFLRLAGRALTVVKFVGRGSFPVWCVCFRILSVFTMLLPQLWYRTLKAVHARGSEWSYAFTGVVLLVVSFVLQIISIARSP